MFKVIQRLNKKKRKTLEQELPKDDVYICKVRIGQFVCDLTLHF